jgi:hypothetical protein
MTPHPTLPLLAAFLLAACGVENDSASPEPDDLPSLPFPFRTAGTFETPPAEGFWGPIDMVSVADHVWILDHKADRVYRYDSRGRYLATLSRQGHGPGELSGAMAIGAVGDTLWVFNAGNRRIDYWDMSGNVVGTQPLPEGAEGAIDMISVGDGFVVATAMGTTPLVHFARSMGAAVEATPFGRELSAQEADLRARLAGSERAALPSIYRLEDVAGRIWAYHLYLPLVGIFTESGRLVRLVTFPSDPIEAGNVEVQDRDGRRREIHAAPANPGGTVGVLEGENKEIYLLTHQERAGRQRLLVVSPEGDLLGWTYPPEGQSLAFAAARGQDRYVAAAVGELEEPTIQRLIAQGTVAR